MKGCDFVRGEALGPLCSVSEVARPALSLLTSWVGQQDHLVKVLRSQKMLSSWRKPKKTIGLNLWGATGQDLRGHNQRPPARG